MSIEKFNKLPDCEVLNTHKNIWNAGFKKVRKNKIYTTIAFLFNDEVLQTTYFHDRVRLTNSAR